MENKLTRSPRLNHFLYEMGIKNAYDVINYLPYRYEDVNYTSERNLNDKQHIVVYGKIISLPHLIRHQGLTIVTFEFMTSRGTYFKVVAYNRPYLLKTLNMNDDFTLIGSFNLRNNEINMMNFYKGVIPIDERLKAIYSLPRSFQNHLFSNLVRRCLTELHGHIYSKVPFSYQNKYRLINKEKALTTVHFPASLSDLHQALRHLKYEEALFFSLKNQCIKQANKSLAKIKKEPIDLSLCEPFIKTLPYQLTKDQLQASEEIIDDMNQSSLMYRLLQGDVGTGKTVVAFLALFANYLRGDQGVLMAPTDALARQHFANAQKIFASTKIKIGLLLGSTPISEKKMIYQDLLDGTIDILIGTHALFSKAVIYSSLGLAIIDEQHRFGVDQRIALSNKGEHADLLMMSATPIPRSLALTLYGDLDISTLAVFPHQKRDVTTQMIVAKDPLIDTYINQSLASHRNVYIVAPLIDFRDDKRYSVEKLYEIFSLKYGKNVGFLHGKMKQNEKEAVLESFNKGEILILVSTPVIEVGIDVKRANLMIVYDACSFGLASLHQLRGRIGRDGVKAHCLLVTDEDDDGESINKLETLVKTDDGFEIAEADLKIRGPGELTGLRQSGLPNFAFLNVVDDYKIFITARQDAQDIMAMKEKKEYQWLIEKAKQDIVYDPLIKG